jgi:polysaccharide biosynthesis/export protein
MYFEQQAWARRTFIAIAIVLLATSAPAAYAQSSSSSPAAQPVLPASSDDSAAAGKDMAKATPLPSTDTPASRVASVRLDTYIIGVGDVLGVNVWKEGELSKNVQVRPDGMITLPLIGEIKAVGLTPVQLKDEITTDLDKVMSDPQVVVIVDAVNSLSFNIMGQVYKPGYFPLIKPLTVLDALALSGGFKDFAHTKKIYILRATPDGKQVKLHFNYKQVIRGQNMAQNIMLEPRDTIVVP